MRVGLLQCDGKYPNLALMKISKFHEDKGDEVTWYDGGLFNDLYDRIYASKIFAFTPMPSLPMEKSFIGGTGIDFYNRLPEEIEKSDVSYTLYPECNYHIGFSMKGCRFACKFCCVPKKEGRPYVHNTIDEILTNPKGGNRLMLLDNDFFGGQNWRENLARITELKLKVNFNQGLNIRILTQEQADLLAKCNFVNSKFNKKYVTFAWDKYKDKELIHKGIDICGKAGIKPEQMQFFVLVGFDTTPEQDLERIMTLKNLGALPFVMPYNKEDNYQKKLARWVNNRIIFRSVKWEDYDISLG
jgi:hypothetical protein